MLAPLAGCYSASPARTTPAQQRARWSQQELAFRQLREATPVWAREGAPAPPPGRFAGEVRVRATWSGPTASGSAVAAAARQLGLQPESPQRFSPASVNSAIAALRAIPGGGYLQTPPTILRRAEAARSLMGQPVDSMQFTARTLSLTPGSATVQFAFQRYLRLPGQPYGRVETLLDTQATLRPGEAFVIWTRSGSLRPNDSNDVVLILQLESVTVYAPEVEAGRGGPAMPATRPTAGVGVAGTARPAENTGAPGPRVAPAARRPAAATRSAGTRSRDEVLRPR
jgi:hypothetical protein